MSVAITKVLTVKKSESNSMLVSSWAEAESAIAADLQNAAASVFDKALVIVPSKGHERHLSQTISKSNGYGICAGVDFVTLGGLRRRLSKDLCGIDPQNDPWQLPELSLSIVNVFQSLSTQPWFRPIAKHLAGSEDRPGRLSVTARRVARLYLHYLKHSPDLLIAWQSGKNVCPSGDPLPKYQRWQAEIWRLLCASIDVPNPSERHEILIEKLVSDAGSFPKVFLAAVIADPIPQDKELLDALVGHAGLEIWQLALPEARNNDFLARYGIDRLSGLTAPTSGETTMLEKVQNAILRDEPAQACPQPDGTIEFHASHGPSRQVEVLRDVLAEVFESDRSLEPKDVLVLAPNLNRFSTHISALFNSEEVSTREHPAKNLRVQLATASIFHTNSIVEMLQSLLDLIQGRGHISELLDFLSLPPVSAKFDLSEEDLQTISELFTKTNTSWGIDSQHRSRYDLGSFAVGTWWNSIQRMLTGAIFADEPPTAVKDVAALAQIESSTLDVIGKLAEAVSRIRKCIFSFAKPATASEWACRLIETAQELAQVDSENEWQLAHAVSKLSRLANSSRASRVLLSSADIRGWLEEINRPRASRPNFGNGSLLIAQLGELQAIEHKVVCVLGLNDEDFPARRRPIGDDLLPEDHLVSNPKRASRQQLLDALLAAEDKFVVITQSASSKTGNKLAPPIAVLDILDACGVKNPQKLWENPDEKLLISHPLQAYNKRNFSAARPSFDPRAYSGAVTRPEPEAKTPAPLWATEFDNELPTEFTIDQVVKFLRNPAAALLASASGLNLNTYETEVQTELPISPDGLSVYALRSQMIDELLSGVHIDRVEYVAGLSGKVVLNEQGKELVNDVVDQAAHVAQDVLAARGNRPASDHNITLSFSGRQQSTCLLSGDIRTWDGKVIIHRAGRLKAISLAEAWVKLSMLSASGLAPKEAVVISTDAVRRLAAPGEEQAQLWLSDLILLLQDGSRQLVPLPIDTAAAYMGEVWNRNSSDRPDWRFSQTWSNRQGFGEYDRDLSWQHFYRDASQLLLDPPHALDPTPPNTDIFDSRAKQLSAWLFQPIRKAQIR